MEKYASLTILFFYTHHDTFDDVLMYNYPIPGTTIDPKHQKSFTAKDKQILLEKLWAKDRLKDRSPHL